MTYTIIDIETTGLNKVSDNILEVGYIITNRDCELLKYGSFYFYKPEWNIETKTQSVHKLTRSFLEQYEADFNINLAKLYSMVYNSIIIGKNSNAFDLPFIINFLHKYAPTLAPLSCWGTLDLQDIYAPYYREWYKNTYGQPASTRKKGTLSELMNVIGKSQSEIEKEFGQTFPEESRSKVHSALYDVFMTYLLLVDGKENRGLKLNI